MMARIEDQVIKAKEIVSGNDYRYCVVLTDPDHEVIVGGSSGLQVTFYGCVFLDEIKEGDMTKAEEHFESVRRKEREEAQERVERAERLAGPGGRAGP
jgi:hypothetical protein